jgi:hypothetical protein
MIQHFKCADFVTLSENIVVLKLQFFNETVIIPAMPTN